MGGGRNHRQIYIYIYICIIIYIYKYIYIYNYSYIIIYIYTHISWHLEQQSGDFVFGTAMASCEWRVTRPWATEVLTNVMGLRWASAVSCLCRQTGGCRSRKCSNAWRLPERYLHLPLKLNSQNHPNPLSMAIFHMLIYRKWSYGKLFTIIATGHPNQWPHLSIK